MQPRSWYSPAQMTLLLRHGEKRIHKVVPDRLSNSNANLYRLLIFNADVKKNLSIKQIIKQTTKQIIKHTIKRIIKQTIKQTTPTSNS